MISQWFKRNLIKAILLFKRNLFDEFRLKKKIKFHLKIIKKQHINERNSFRSRERKEVTWKKRANVKENSVKKKQAKEKNKTSILWGNTGQ